MRSLLGLLLFIGKALAAPMMLSSAELEAIGAIPESSDSAQLDTLERGGGAKPRLDGIVYYQEDNWCVWLNGQRFSPGQQPAKYKIIKVSPDKVEIISTDDINEAQPITLRLGQF